MIETLIVLKDSTSSRYESSYAQIWPYIENIWENEESSTKKKTCAKGLLTFTTFQCDQKLEFRELFETLDSQHGLSCPDILGIQARWSQPMHGHIFQKSSMK